ncbi:uncharacterized protein LOC111081417 isoform X4 [Drosophila obscura]|uniref:uncharacterized protein LOC111081417 isoform X4 n=1 Tax=Drosophila obscura TaxID=7282 RepID=UPI001BB0F895|nr:uncharacterized protein LOC111081417 isoform X4 [Drosophila obscura]
MPLGICHCGGDLHSCRYELGPRFLNSSSLRSYLSGSPDPTVWQPTYGNCVDPLLPGSSVCGATLPISCSVKIVSIFHQPTTSIVKGTTSPLLQSGTPLFVPLQPGWVSARSDTMRSDAWIFTWKTWSSDKTQPYLKWLEHQKTYGYKWTY